MTTSHTPTKPHYLEDYRDRTLYKQFYDTINREMLTTRHQHHHTHPGVITDAKSDTAVSTYLEVLAALDYCEDIMSLNCDDYVSYELDKRFAVLRKSMQKRIDAGAKRT